MNNRLKKYLYIVKKKALFVWAIIFFKRMNVMNDIDTIDFIIKNKCSISRLGNGEMDIIVGDSKKFQTFNKQLKNELIRLKTTNNMLLCVPYLLENKDSLKKQNNTFYKIHRSLYLYYWRRYYRKNHILGDSCLTRFYMDKIDKTNTLNYVSKFKKIWDNKDVLFVEGKYTKLGVGNDLFSNTKSISRLICPFQNAYDKIDAIEQFVVDKIDKKTLIILALGPTASVLSGRLSRKGFWSLDLGHIDIEYEWYLKGADSKIAIPGKYVAEASDNLYYAESNNDVCEEQIVGIIT